MALEKNPKIDIKRKYYRVFQLSLILSLSLLILAFKYFPDVEKFTLISDEPQDLIISISPPIVDLAPIPPPPPKPPIPIEAPTDDVLDDIVIETNILDVNAVTALPPPPKVIDDSPIPDIFVVVEEMPVPIGGIADIQKRIVYPEIAVRAGIHGKVFVKAFVDENGNVFKVELQKGIGGGCDKAAMEAVKNAKFYPGKQRGEPVKVQITIPILFKLQ